jgi:hypothetical protein
MPTVNENLPEDHRDHVTDFGDIRDEPHMPPGNSSDQPAPTQDELAEANAAVEEARGTVQGDASVADEDLVFAPHQGSSSWVSDPDAVSSDATQAAQPGYGGEEEVEYGATPDEGQSLPLVETGTEDNTVEDVEFDPTQYTIAEVEAYVKDNPDDLARVLQAEHDSPNPRSSLITKLENMGS